MSQYERIVAASPATDNLIAQLTAEVWLNPNAAEGFAKNRLGFLQKFAAEQGYLIPSNLAIDDLELQPSPVGDLDLATPVHGQTTTAQSNCNSNDGSCGPNNSFFCISHNPGSCASQNFDCPSQKCTVYPCGA